MMIRQGRSASLDARRRALRFFVSVVAAAATALSLAGTPRALAADLPGDLARAERDLQQAFEGSHVTVLLDMPATAQGIDITPEAEKPLNFPDYQARLKKAGIALKRGEAVMVTKVKVKSKLIEFQLGGGGYGTFFDEKAGGSGGGPVGKSTREKNLERDLKRERDPGKRRAMEEELDRLRRERQRDERETHAESRQAEALDKDRIRDKALSGGSRFNIRYPDGVTSESLTPESVTAVLEKYVDFRDASGPRDDRDGDDRGDRDHRDGGDQGRGIHKGATVAEVAALYGAPVSTSQRTDGGWNVLTNRYRKGTQRLEATFIEGVLVRYTLSEE